MLSDPLITTNFSANIFKLPNGLSVIHQCLPATPVVVVDVWVRAGAIAEPQEWTGMAHFLEHMIFKGTQKLAPGVFDSVIESHGGLTNAATSHDYAHFFLTTANRYLEDTLPPLADLLLHAAIPDDEFERERDVVLEEIRACFDNPDWIGFQALSENIYQRHPYGRSVLGTEMQLMAQSPQQMRSFHATHYQPENMTVVITGGVEQASALELVNKSFENFCNPSYCPILQSEAEPPITEIRRQELYLPRIEQARLLMAWIGPGVEGLRDAYGLDLLSVLLADGRSSRLVRELREELRWVQGISSGFSLQRDSSLFTISAYLEPQYLEQVEAHICDRLLQLQTTPVSQKELSRCQRLLCNDYIFSTEAAGQLAGLYGYYNTIATAELAVTYPRQIQGLTPSDLMVLAQQYLSPHHYAVTVLKPIAGDW
ncbi:MULTISPECIES: M16 family metallopeptidase [unclassified Coleofasciculus]|uniref:M16 family metallopeptidase n=1 Tax=Coleofasciculus sp. LEGE 07092 TaxID=2777969 RepID=UPI00188182B9|nr:insulinase family protein [Coleofasciculus sp. LEGE 07081]MBE9146948.1 insulinase family protein [Coleofasciculus sp. LEGE 07092]